MHLYLVKEIRTCTILHKQSCWLDNIEYFELHRFKLEISYGDNWNGNLIGSITGTVFGVAALTKGRKGLALHIHGQYVDFGYQGDTCLGYFILCTNGWVTAFWVQLERDKNGVIMDTGAIANKGMRIIVTEERYFVINFRGDNKRWRLGGGATSEQSWVHVVVTWQTFSGTKLYIDGELVEAVSCPSSLAEPVIQETRFVLGASSKHHYMFEGSLDELRVWDTVMTDEEVMELYTVDAGGTRV